jgi:hypothetical protein
VREAAKRVHAVPINQKWQIARNEIILLIKDEIESSHEYVHHVQEAIYP